MRKKFCPKVIFEKPLFGVNKICDGHIRYVLKSLMLTKVCLDSVKFGFFINDYTNIEMTKMYFM